MYSIIFLFLAFTHTMQCALPSPQVIGPEGQQYVVPVPPAQRIFTILLGVNAHNVPYTERALRALECAEVSRACITLEDGAGTLETFDAHKFLDLIARQQSLPPLHTQQIAQAIQDAQDIYNLSGLLEEAAHA